MSIMFERIRPAVEEALADEPDVSTDAVWKVLEALMPTLTASIGRAREDEGVDLILEDASGQITLLELKTRGDEPGHQEVILTGSLVETLAATMTEWVRHNRSYREVLDALAPKDRGPLSAAGTLQARRNAQARRELLEEVPTLTSSEVADAAGSKAANRASLANRWRDEQRVFGIRVGDQWLFPAFQFDDGGRPLPEIRAVLERLNEGELTDWQTALWFASPAGWLGGRRPIDLLEDEPEAVVEAARREAGELVA